MIPAQRSEAVSPWDRNSPPAPSGLKLQKIDHIPERSSTRYRDFGFHEYAPRCSPIDHLHSATVLRYLLRVEGFIDQVWPMIERLWHHLGRDKVIWGAKWTRAGFHSFELYLYNSRMVGPQYLRTLPGLRDVLHPWLDDIAISEIWKYDICSFDIDASLLRTQRASGAHIYVPIGDLNEHPDFFSYGLHPDGIRLENHYTTIFTETGLDVLRERLRWSVHSRTDKSRRAVLPARLCRCFRIAYATKPLSDSVYFNQVATSLVLWFARQHLPASFASMLERNRPMFEHLLWDVSFDFHTSHEGENAFAYTKFGIYGFV
jgi:hypothetical protein